MQREIQKSMARDLHLKKIKIQSPNPTKNISYCKSPLASQRFLHCQNNILNSYSLKMGKTERLSNSPKKVINLKAKKISLILESIIAFLLFTQYLYFIQLMHNQIYPLIRISPLLQMMNSCQP